MENLKKVSKAWISLGWLDGEVNSAAIVLDCRMRSPMLRRTVFSKEVNAQAKNFRTILKEIFLEILRAGRWRRNMQIEVYQLIISTNI